MRLAPALALSAALLAGACTDPYGRPDPGATLGLAAGAAALGGLAYLATRDDGPKHRHDAYRPRYDRGGYGYGYQPGYYGPGPYGGW